MQVAHLDAVLGKVIGQILAMRLVSVVTAALAGLYRALISERRSSTWVAAGRTSSIGSTSPVGRTTCSTTGLVRALVFRGRG